MVAFMEKHYSTEKPNAWWDINRVRRCNGEYGTESVNHRDRFINFDEVPMSFEPGHPTTACRRRTRH